MIKCLHCDYDIPSGLKYVLKQNICPACGRELLSPRDIRVVQSVEAKIYSDGPLAKILEEHKLTYDVSLFVFNEYLRPALEKRDEAAKRKADEAADEDAGNEGDVTETVEGSDEDVEFDPEAIKAEVKKEMMGEEDDPITDDDPDIEIDPEDMKYFPEADFSDESDRLARLKAQAKKGTGVARRRLADTGGATSFNAYDDGGDFENAGSGGAGRVQRSNRTGPSVKRVN